MKSKLLHAATLAAAAIALTLLVAACGGGSGETDGDGAAAKQDPQEAALEYAQCMREHGVDMPDPDPNGGIQLSVGPGDDPEKIEQAQKACDDILQNAGSPLSAEQESALQDALLAFAKCMREHGIDMPDPQFGEGGRVTQRDDSGNALNPDDPKFREAQKACEPIMEKAQQEAGLPEQSPGFQTQDEDS